eukprot:66310-Prymnesium_polylepis.1
MSRCGTVFTTEARGRARGDRSGELQLYTYSVPYLGGLQRTPFPANGRGIASEGLWHIGLPRRFPVPTEPVRRSTRARSTSSDRG